MGDYSLSRGRVNRKVRSDKQEKNGGSSAFLLETTKEGKEDSLIQFETHEEGERMLTLLVLAAGMGSRYGGLKQLDAVGPHGETLMDYSIYDAKQAGFERVVFVIRKEIEEAFRNQIGRRYEGILPLAYAYQELTSLPSGFTPPPGRTKPWGTGHAILVARSHIQTPFAVINADDFYGREGYQAIAHYLHQGEGDGCLVGYRLESTLSSHGSVSRGICQLSPSGCLEAIQETHHIHKEGGEIQEGGEIRASNGEGGWISLTGEEWVSMNLWGFFPSIFAELEEQFIDFLRRSGGDPKAEFYIPSVVTRMIREKKKRIALLHCEARWFGVTYKEDKHPVEERLRALVEEGIYPSPLWN